MNKIDTIKLKNGLSIYLYSDKKRHSTFFQFTTFCGGINKHFIMDNKKYTLPDGVHHMLEHYIVECNDNGNFLDILGRRQMSTNASTSIRTTSYYFEAVEDIEFGINTILKSIYNVTFDKEKLERLKNPIRQEIRGRLDNKFHHAHRKRINNLFKYIDYRDVGGTLEEIDSITINDLELLYKAFYKPSNQFIVIAGNFNKELVLNIIKEFYKDLVIPEHNTILIPYKDILKVNKKREVFYFPTPITYVELSFKIDISKYSSNELLDLDFYLHTFYNSCFGVSSKLHKKLIDEKVITEGISTYDMIIDKYLVIVIGGYTFKPKVFEKEILNEINTLSNVNLNDFNLDKDNSILHILLRSENIFKVIMPFINNIVYYNYPYMDDIRDVEELNYNDMLKMLKDLDFSNYSVLTIKNKRE